MYGISTSWKSAKCNYGEELVKQIQETEIFGIELDYRVTSEIFQQMKVPLKKSNISILSIHNFFPHPEILPRHKASGDAFLLSSLDENERELAIKYSRRTLQFAHDLEAQAVVFHMGKIEMDWDKKKWFEIIDNDTLETSESKDFISDKLQQRAAKSSKHFDAVLFSLDKLNNEAIKRNVKIGIENRYYGNDIPNFDEIGALLKIFDGGNIGYWHDCGHAQTTENYGLETHEQFLKAYSAKLLGIHIHDCNGYNDHIAPGFGTIDFQMIKKYLPEKAIKIIEVHNKVSLSELKQGVNLLHKTEII